MPCALPRNNKQMLVVTPTLSIDDAEIEEQFIRSSGPGGQNVNKVETAVQIRFDAANSKALSRDVFNRLRTLAGSRMTRDGIIVLTAQSHRSQDRNRKDARNRLAALIARALVPPKRRKPTKPSRAAKQQRLDAKKKRSLVKKSRRQKPDRDGW